MKLQKAHVQNWLNNSCFHYQFNFRLFPLKTKPTMRILLTLVFCAILTQSIIAQKTISGFDTEAAKKQAELESKFDSYLKAENLDAWMKRLAGRPHHLGSAYGKQNA